MIIKENNEKIALAACTGMSANGLVSRIAVYDTQKELDNIIHICIPSTAAESNKSIKKIINKYPIIAVNGCENSCVNKILKDKNIKVNKSINVNKELENCKVRPINPARCGKREEIAVNYIKKILIKKANEIGGN
ncbi:hypothetical protein BGI41_06840 [Methanobrevibacter sp. 87.7]|uniref:putative zinc-binding protein n=1 Tax=Methanobrevibacter sp. 87.7 TaxID=387957 RepID=UPI000B50568F|nr:putative zinc-binding protein [Methanobrevibacter sp. 87.7]OWT32595.1 hypothetical protein BGI41_06840 [Methanobrevibacter sp. 87.7]